MIKQVIVIRKDLKMRRGKEIAQGSHASVAFLAQHVRDGTPLTEAEKEWIDGHFTKVCLQVDSEDQLLEVHKKCQDAGVRSILITDRGLTEFDGKPTNTCIGVGPDEASKIDAITGHLKLY